MRRIEFLWLTLVLLSACSKQAEMPQAGSSGIPATATAALNDAPPISEVTVKYDPAAPEFVVVNGRSLKLADLQTEFPSEWRRLSPSATDGKSDPWSALKIQVDAATRFRTLRRIHDAAGEAGARHAELVVSGKDVSPKSVGDRSLKIDISHPIGELRSPDPLKQQEHLALQLEALDDGRLSWVSAPPMPRLSAGIAAMILSDEIARIAAKSAAAGREAPLALLSVDDSLRVDQLASIIAACEYYPEPGSRKIVPLLKSVTIAPLSKPTIVAAPPTPPKPSPPTTPTVAPSGPPVSQVVVAYDSKSPDDVTVNGDSLKIADLAAKFPGQWRRLPDEPNGRRASWDKFRIEVNAAAPFAVIRRIHDAAQAAGARHATLVVDGHLPPSDAEHSPLRIELPPSNDKYRWTETSTLDVRSRVGGHLEAITVNSRPLGEQDLHAALTRYVLIKVSQARAAGQADPLFALLPDDGLRADELAKLIFACEYRVPASGKLEPLTQRVFVAPTYATKDTVKLKKKIVPSQILSEANGRLPPMIPTPTPTRRGLGLSNPAYNQNPAGGQLKIPPQ